VTTRSPPELRPDESAPRSQQTNEASKGRNKWLQLTGSNKECVEYERAVNQRLQQNSIARGCPRLTQNARTLTPEKTGVPGSRKINTVATGGFRFRLREGRFVVGAGSSRVFCRTTSLWPIGWLGPLLSFVFFRSIPTGPAASVPSASGNSEHCG